MLGYLASKTQIKDSLLTKNRPHTTLSNLKRSLCYFAYFESVLVKSNWKEGLFL